MTLPWGTRIALAEILPWVQLSGQRDLSTSIVYIGFILALLGGFLMVAVFRVDSLVLREPVDGGIKLTVLMRPYRFAPLFATSFEALWERSSGLLKTVPG